MFKIVKKVQFSEKVFRLDVEAPLVISSLFVLMKKASECLLL